MRSLLHAPRTRRRSIAAATLGALALVGSLLVATPAQAINDTGTGGVFVPASGRVLDTKVGTGGFSTPMEANKYRTIKIAGAAGIPDDGTVGAVSLNASVNGTVSNGTLFGRPDANTSRTMMLIYNGTAGEYVSNSAIVAVSAEGTIQVATETSARLILDVQGYYTANAEGTAAGGFVPVAGKRVVDTRSGLGATKATIGPGKSVDIQVAGTNGVPLGASGAVVNLLPINTTSSDGYLTPYATGTSRPSNALHYAPSTNTSVQAQVQLSTDGKMTIYNGSSTINLVVDLQGYFTAAGNGGATFTPGIGRVYDSRAAGNTILAKNATRSIQLSGRAGIPVMGSGINAVVVTLTAYHAGSEGRAVVWANGTDKPDTTAINFRNDEIRTNTITVPLGANGKISLNNVADPTHYLVDVQGWYSNPHAPEVSCGSYSGGSWTPAIPDSVTCSIVAPPAASSGQELVVDGGDVELEPVLLSDKGMTNAAITFEPSGGTNDVSATIFDSNANFVTQSELQFELGDWSTAELSTFPSDGQRVSGDVLLAVYPSDNSAFLDDTTSNFSVAADPDMTNVIWSGQVEDSEIAVPSGLLVDGDTYYWQAVVTGPTNWDGDPVNRTTPVSALTADASVVDVEPSDDSLESASMALRGPSVAHVTTRKVVDKKLLSNRYTNWKDPIGGCKSSKGSQCIARITEEAKVEVQTSFGISRGAVTSSLGITNAKTVGYGIEDRSPVFKKDGMFYLCAPMGKRFKYKIQQTKHYSLFGASSTKSKWRYAFEPIHNVMECKFVKN